MNRFNKQWKDDRMSVIVWFGSFVMLIIEMCNIQSLLIGLEEVVESGAWFDIVLVFIALLTIPIGIIVLTYHNFFKK